MILTFDELDLRSQDSVFKKSADLDVIFIVLFNSECRNSDIPTNEPHLNIYQVMTEHTKVKFNNLI